jgi:ethanolamine utilization cobalamin adenosyltransferase
MDSLTDTDRTILDLEHQWWATAGAKEDAIRALGMTPVRYYQRLNQLLESEAALTYDAVVVNRLRRIAGHEDR